MNGWVFPFRRPSIDRTLDKLPSLTFTDTDPASRIKECDVVVSNGPRCLNLANYLITKAFLLKEMVLWDCYEAVCKAVFTKTILNRH